MTGLHISSCRNWWEIGNVKRFHRRAESLFTSASSLQALYPMVWYLNGEHCGCCGVQKIDLNLEYVNLFVTFGGIFGQELSFETFKVELLTWHAKMQDWK